MGTTANSVLDQRLHQLIGDYIQVTLTTDLAASSAIVSTNLNAYDLATDNHFKNYWCYVTNYANATAERKINTYATSGGVCAVYGSNFTADSSGDKATVRFYKYSYTAGQTAINDAIREIGSDVLFRHIDDRSLVTNNVLWNGDFEQWTDSSAPTFWTSDSGSMAQTTTAGVYRGAVGTTSCKFTADTADDYIYQTYTANPRLLDCMGQTVHLYAWVYPETEDDPTITLYTLKADSDATAQTLASTTSATAGVWTLLKLENQAVNDDVVNVQLKLAVATEDQYCYFDKVRVISNRAVYEYMLPEPFQDGEVCQVYIQTSGYSDQICDDIMPSDWERIYGWEIVSDGTYKFLRLPANYGGGRQIRLIGTSPLSTVSTYTGTTEVDGRELDLLIMYAAYCLFRNEEGMPSSEDTARFQSRAYRYLREYERMLPTLRMLKPTGTINMPRP